MTSKKGQQVFGTVLTLAAVAASGGLLAGLGGAWAAGGAGALWISGAAVAYGAWSARKARKDALSATDASMEGRKIMVRSGILAKNYLYGRGWVSGSIVYVREPLSPDDRNFWCVLALPIAHKISGIEAIVFGETVLTPLAANGTPQPGPFSQVLDVVHTEQGIVPDNKLWVARGKGEDFDETIEVIPGTITCAIGRPQGVQTGAEQDSNQPRIYPDEQTTLYPGTNVIHLGDNANPGDTFTLTYTYRFTRTYMQVWQYLGDANQVANQPLIDATAGPGVPPDRRWTSDHRLQGIPYLVFRMWVDPDVYPRDLENITVFVRGKDNILDTRTGAIGFSDNPMLCARDYALARCGVLSGEIDNSLLNAHANACDEAVFEPDSRKRFMCDVLLSTEAQPLDNLGIILTSCDGSASYSGNTFDIRGGIYETPTLILGDSDFAGPPEISKSPPRMDLFNGVGARYQDETKLFWPLVEAPAYHSAFYRQQDGGRENIRELDFPAVRRAVQVQRLMKQTLHRARAAMRVRATTTVKTHQFSPEMTIFLNLRAIGSVNKPFLIKAVNPVSANRVELEMQETGPLLYQYSFDEAAGVDPAPNSVLPSIRDVPSVQNLHAITSEQAAVFGPDGDLEAQCQVKWSPVGEIPHPGRMLVLSGGYIEVRHKISFNGTYTYSPRLPPTAIEYRFPIKRGDVLHIGVRLSNSLVHGKWYEIKKVADDTPTGYLTGNLLVNPRFSYDHPLTDVANNSLHYEGWSRVQGVNASSEMGPYPFLSGSTVTPRDPANPGYVFWSDAGDSSRAPQTWIYSARIAVVPGHRMLAYCTTYDYYSQQYLYVGWYNGSDGKVGEGMLSPANSSWLIPGSLPLIPGVTFLRQTYKFGVVPPGATLARLFLVSYRRTGIAADKKPLPIWFRPYFGRASDGQVTLPPWSA